MALCRGKGFESDVATVLLGMDAQVNLLNLVTGQATRAPLLSYLSREAGDGCLVLSLFLPPPPPNAWFKTYRVAIRPQNAHALVNAAFMVEMEAPSGPVTGARIIYGGVNPRHAVRISAAEACLLGFPLSEASIEAAIAAVTAAISLKDLAVSSSGPYPESPSQTKRLAYRHGLCASLLRKFCIAVRSGDRDSPGIEPEVPRVIASQRITCAEGHNPDGPLGEPVIKLGAEKQTSGEAVYVDDVPLKEALFAAYALAPIAKGTLRALHTAAALEYPGVECVLTADDIPGENIGSGAFTAETLLVPLGGRIDFHSKPVAIVVADTYAHAREAAKLVQALCDEEEPVLSIEDAIAKGEGESRGPYGRDGLCGGWGGLIEVLNLDGERIKEGTWKEKESRYDAKMQAKVGSSPGGLVRHAGPLIELQGGMEIGSQNHFYMECQGAAAAMDEGLCTVWASTQSPQPTWAAVAKCLGLAENQIIFKQRRAGGAFGGKLTRGIHVACAAALCAWKTGRNVKLTLDRNTDMKLVGGRHFMKSEWDVVCDREGRMEGLKHVVHMEAGHSPDLTGFVMMSLNRSLTQTYRFPQVPSTPPPNPSPSSPG